MNTTALRLRGSQARKVVRAHLVVGALVTQRVLYDNEKAVARRKDGLQPTPTIGWAMILSCRVGHGCMGNGPGHRA